MYFSFKSIYKFIFLFAVCLAAHSEKSLIKFILYFSFNHVNIRNSHNLFSLMIQLIHVLFSTSSNNLLASNTHPFLDPPNHPPLTQPTQPPSSQPTHPITFLTNNPPNHPPQKQPTQPPSSKTTHSTTLFRNNPPITLL